MRELRHSPYTYATWLTPLLSGDAQCWFSVWIRSQYKLDLLDRGGFDLVKWKADHAEMLKLRAGELRKEGYGVSLEDQNSFTLRGRVGTLAGKPDIVAEKGLDVLVVDSKSGQRRPEHVHQVLLYLFALPLWNPARFAGKRLSGEVQYRDGSIPIPAEQVTDELRARIKNAMLAVCTPTIQPEPVPSARECAWCPVSKTDCSARIETAPAPVEVETW